jgi:hypothetical protein
MPHVFKIKGVSNLFIRLNKVGQIQVVAAKLIGEWFYVSAKSKDNNDIIAMVHIKNGEFKLLKASSTNGKLVIRDFIDVGPAGVVLEVEMQQQICFWHLNDIHDFSKMEQAHQNACLGKVVIPGKSQFWSIGKNEAVIKEFNVNSQPG